MRTIALIPARSGSKSIPDKNVKPLAGKPLLAWSVEIGLACPSVDRVIVSTDSDSIARVALDHGAEVPFLRPPELAQDDTPDLPVFVHCIEWMTEHEGAAPDLIVQLRPTSPLRTVEMVEDAIALLRDDPKADSVRTMCTPTQEPYKMWRIGDDGYAEPLLTTDHLEPYNQPRQELPASYWQNGYVDVMRARTVMGLGSMTGRRILPLVVHERYVLDIDTPVTWRLAEAMLEERTQR